MGTEVSSTQGGLGMRMKAEICHVSHAGGRVTAPVINHWDLRVIATVITKDGMNESFGRLWLATRSP